MVQASRQRSPLTTVVLVGRGGMPAFKDDLGDAELAAILTYVRQAWGNKGGAQEATDVAAPRVRASAIAQPKNLQAH